MYPKIHSFLIIIGQKGMKNNLKIGGKQGKVEVSRAILFLKRGSRSYFCNQLLDNFRKKVCKILSDFVIYIIREIFQGCSKFIAERTGVKQMEKCENKKMVYLAIGLTIIGSICIVVDQIFKIYVCELDNLVEILFNLVSVVAGIWVTCYLLFLQIYKDSYPLKIINEQYLPQIKIFFVYAIFSILYGSVVITINNGFLEAIYFAAVALFSIIKILYHTYKCSRSLMVNTYMLS